MVVVDEVPVLVEKRASRLSSWQVAHWALLDATESQWDCRARARRDAVTYWEIDACLPALNIGAGTPEVGFECLIKKVGGRPKFLPHCTTLYHIVHIVYICAHVYICAELCTQSK